MVIFRCEIPIARCYKQFLEGAKALAMSGMSCTYTGLLAIACNANLFSMGLVIASSNIIWKLMYDVHTSQIVRFQTLERIHCKFPV